MEDKAMLEYMELVIK